MASLTNLLVGIFEEQAALLIKHIAVLKGNAVTEPVAVVADKKKPPKAIADPDMPKKGPNAYFVYMSENQAPFKASNPTMSQAEIMTTLGKRWTSLTPEAKERFHKQAESLKVSQSQKIAAYLATKPTSSSSSVAVKSPSKSAAKAEAAKAAPQPVVAEVKTPIAPPTPVAAQPLVVFAPVVAVSSPVGSELKEHKKKKKRKTEEEVVEVAPAATVIEALPVAVPESEKKKVSVSPPCDRLDFYPFFGSHES